MALSLVRPGVLKVWGSRTPLLGDITLAMQGNKVNYLLPERDLDCRITRGRDGVSQEIMPTLKDKMD